jgi:hypothetical protein
MADEGRSTHRAACIPFISSAACPPYFAQANFGLYSRRSMGAASTRRAQWRWAALLAVGGVTLLAAGLPSIVAPARTGLYEPNDAISASPPNTSSTEPAQTGPATTPLPGTSTEVPPPPPEVTVSTPSTPTPASPAEGSAASEDAPTSELSPAATLTPTNTGGSATPLAYISATTGLLSALASLIVAMVALKAKQSAANNPQQTRGRSVTKRRRK